MRAAEKTFVDWHLFLLPRITGPFADFEVTLTMELCSMAGPAPLHVLIVEDRPSDVLLMVEELRQAGFDPTWECVQTESDFVARLASAPELILSDYRLLQFDVLRALSCLRERGLDIPLIIVSKGIGEDLAVEAMKDGAADFVLKDRLGRLGLAVTQALSQKKQRESLWHDERAVLENQQRTRLILDTANDPFIVMDRDGRIIEWNRAAKATFGWPREVALGRFLTETIVPPRYCEAHKRGLQHFMATGEGRILNKRIELLALHRDGHELPIELMIWPIRLGEAVAFSAFVRDITERKLAEAALRETEQRLQQIVNTTPAVIYVTKANSDGRVPTWVSQSIERLTGFVPAEVMVDQWWETHVHPDDLAGVLETMSSVAMQDACAVEYRLRHRDGEFRWVLDQCRVVRDAEGLPTEIVGSWLDITSQKLLEEQFRQSQKMEAVGRLAGGVAHDFNNLLTIIAGYCELALDRLGEGDPLRDYLEEISHAGARAAALTGQLLAFSRRQLLAPAVIDLNQVLAEMEKMLGRLIGENIELLIHADPDLWHVKVTPGQIEQVAMNLAINARDAMPQGGKLTIATGNVELDENYVGTHSEARPGKYVKVSVSDTGCGMDSAVRERAFEPFFTTKGIDQGTGLGLSTVYGIVTQSGGHIELDSAPGMGTTVTIYIPGNRDSAAIRNAPPREPSLACGTETVLLVEDEAGVRALMRMVLDKKGYTVLEAGNPQEALQLLEHFQDSVHLLISDVVMPGMGGREMAEQMLQVRPTLKVMYISGYTDDIIVRHGILDSGTPFLQKPFAPEALARKVRQILDSH